MTAASLSAVLPSHARANWQAFGALALGIACISFSAIFVKWAGVSGPASGFYRVFIAALILAPIWLVRHRQSPQPLPSKKVLVMAVLAGLFFAGDLAMYNTSILLTSAANATLLGNNAPIFVAIIAWLVFRKRPARSYWIGLALAMIGAIAIVGFDMIRHPSFGLGDFLAVAASLCFAGYLIAVERSRATLDTLTLITITVSTSAIALLVLSLFMGVSLGGYSAPAWLSLIGLGVICQVGGYMALTYALGHLPATVTSVCLLIQAPLTAILAMRLLGEAISSAQVVGGALVLGGVYFANRSESA